MPPACDGHRAVVGAEHHRVGRAVGRFDRDPIAGSSPVRCTNCRSRILIRHALGAAVQLKVGAQGGTGGRRPRGRRGPARPPRHVRRVR